MKRKIYDQLLLWKNKRKGKSAMMIEGARRVGKSYIVKEFAQKEYKSYILIDFFKVGDDIKDLFKNYKDNLDMLFTYLSTYFSTKLYPRESIIVFVVVSNSFQRHSRNKVSKSPPWWKSRAASASSSSASSSMASSKEVG